MDRQEIFLKVSAGLVDALEVEPEEVTPDASLIDELGAESIDFLDITFRMEKAFNFKIPEREMYQGSLNLKEQNLITDGKVNAEGVKLIQEKMPTFDLSRFKDGVIYEADIPRLVTVGTMVMYLEERLAEA